MKSIALITLLALLYFLGGKLSIDMLEGYHIVTVGIFAAEGIALAFALHFGKKILPGIFVGQLALALDNDVSLAPALLISAVNTFEAFVAIKLFEHFRLDAKLSSLRDVTALTLIILFVLQPLSAFGGNTALMLFGEIPKDYFGIFLFAWWFGNVMGQLLFTPFILYGFAHFSIKSLPQYLLFGTFFGLYVALLELYFNISNPVLFLSFTLPFVIVMVATKEIFYGTLFNVVLALVSMYAIYVNKGPFVSAAEFDNVINYNIFMLSHILLVILIGILFEERKRNEKELQKRVEYEVEKNQQQQLLILQQSRLAQMGEMISMIAHQWRQPLNNLALVNQLLISKYQKGLCDDKEIEYFKKQSKAQIEFMSNTIDNFRNYFRHETEKKEFFVEKVIASTIDMVADIFAKSDISIRFSPEKEHLFFGYQNNLVQVLLNIINNAKDALLERDSSTKEIFIEIDDDEEHIYISIEDTAGGVDEAIMAQIFDPYFSTKDEKNGTGLGLYMSKMILKEQMNGDIKVYNTDRGARFEITLKKGH